SAARDAIHHRESQCRARLAGETARIRERKRRSLDGLHRLRLDRPAARNQEPQGSIQDGFGRHRIDYLEREGSAVIASITSSEKEKNRALANHSSGLSTQDPFGFPVSPRVRSTLRPATAPLPPQRNRGDHEHVQSYRERSRRHPGGY